MSTAYVKQPAAVYYPARSDLQKSADRMFRETFFHHSRERMCSRVSSELCLRSGTCNGPRTGTSSSSRHNASECLQRLSSCLFGPTEVLSLGSLTARAGSPCACLVFQQGTSRPRPPHVSPFHHLRCPRGRERDFRVLYGVTSDPQKRDFLAEASPESLVPASLRRTGARLDASLLGAPLPRSPSHTAGRTEGSLTGVDP